MRFDAYTATTSGLKPSQAFQLVMDTVGEVVEDTRKGPGFQRFAERVAFVDESGSQFGSIQTGGAHGDLVMVEVKGEHSPKLVEALRRACVHRCTRVDSCADFDAPRAFERLYRQCRAVKRAHRIIGGKAGDWEDFPERGRTLYLGSGASAVRTRLYEKGKQREYEHLHLSNWARLEVQVRPAKDARDEFSTLSPEQVWGAAKWTRELAGVALKEHVDPHPAGSVYRLRDRERALRFMCAQYGAHLLSLKDDLGGWPEVGLTLAETISELSQERRRQGVEGNAHR